MTGHCELFGNCGFFDVQVADMPSTAEAIRMKYCRSDRERCARYVAWKSSGKVPHDLLPSELEEHR